MLYFFIPLRRTIVLQTISRVYCFSVNFWKIMWRPFCKTKCNRSIKAASSVSKSGYLICKWRKSVSSIRVACRSITGWSFCVHATSSSTTTRTTTTTTTTPFSPLLYAVPQYCIMFLKHERASLIDRAFMEKSERRGAKCECGMHAILADRN